MKIFASKMLHRDPLFMGLLFNKVGDQDRLYLEQTFSREEIRERLISCKRIKPWGWMVSA